MAMHNFVKLDRNGLVIGFGTTDENITLDPNDPPSKRRKIVPVPEGVDLDTLATKWLKKRRWNGKEFEVFEKPATYVSLYEFKKRFTQDERIAFRRAAKEDEQVEDYIDMLESDTVVNVPEVEVYLREIAEEKPDLISIERIEEILTGLKPVDPPASIEEIPPEEDPAVAAGSQPLKKAVDDSADLPPVEAIPEDRFSGVRPVEPSVTEGE